MTRHRTYLLSAGIAIAAVSLTLAACGSSSSSANSSTSTPAATTAPATTAPATVNTETEKNTTAPAPASAAKVAVLMGKPSEFKLTATPTSAPGKVTFAVANEGNVVHEMVVVPAPNGAAGLKQPDGTASEDGFQRRGRGSRTREDRAPDGQPSRRQVRAALQPARALRQRHVRRLHRQLSRPLPTTVNLSALLLDRRLAGHGGEPAVRGPGVNWTLSDLAERVGLMAAGFIRAGIGRGDVVAISLQDGPEWPAVVLGAARIGAVCALVSPAVPRSRARLAIGRANARAVVGDQTTALPATPLLSPDLLEGLGSGRPDPGPAAIRSDEPCYLLMTSGSTGVAEVGRPPARRRADVPGDLRGTGPAAAAGGCHVVGGRAGHQLRLRQLLLLPPRGRRLRVARRSRSVAGGPRGRHPHGGVNVVFGVPTWWARVVRHVEDGRLALGALAGVRLAVSAGEQLPSHIWHRVHEVLGLRLINGLGSSEATNLYLSDRPGGPRAGTLGRPVPGYSLSIAGPDGRASDEGELLVRGDSVMAGYLDDPLASAQALRGGWLHTGDLVRRERDASYTFLGREGDRVKVGALWVSPAHVQAELLRDPDVDYAVVLGVEDEYGLTRLGAVVTVAPGVPRDAGDGLRARCARRLAPHESPRVIVALDEIPALASGKPDRAAITEILADALAQPTTSPAPARR